MIAIVAARRHALAGCLAVLALSQATPLSAGLLTTERTVANFSFKGGAVDYRPDPRAYLQAAGSTTSLAARLPDFGGESGKALDPLSGALFLDAKPDNFGDIEARDFNVFGSLPPADSLPDSTLLDGPIKALGEDSKAAGFYRLIDRKPIVGHMASQYRGAGIYMLVAGLDETTWIAGYKDAASTNQLLSLEDAAANGASLQGALPVPLPGTPILLAAGLPFLMRRHRRRGCPAPPMDAYSVALETCFSGLAADESLRLPMALQCPDICFPSLRV